MVHKSETHPCNSSKRALDVYFSVKKKKNLKIKDIPKHDHNMQAKKIFGTIFYWEKSQEKEWKSH